jgi:trehalose 6-phosphate phosphatase
LDAPRLWLFLDYDGSLVDFAPTPETIEPNPEVVRLLEELARNPTIKITILSGRRLEHVRELLPIRGIFLAGTYGIELMTPSGETIRRVPYEEIRPTLEEIKPQWAQLIEGRSGFFLEDKGWALALHARFADDEESERVLAQARRITKQLSTIKLFRILGGHKFLEIAPRLGSKREAVAYLLNHDPLADARLLYIGDDDKDEEAFPVIHAHQGVAVKVLQPSQRSSPTTADFYFESPAETVRWLQELV